MTKTEKEGAYMGMEQIFNYFCMTYVKFKSYTSDLYKNLLRVNIAHKKFVVAFKLTLWQNSKHFLSRPNSSNVEND